jgi:nucleoside-diphosphate-sugar epimerase
VKKFIEVSTAQVYKSQNSRPSDETATLKPWTKIAAAKFAAEAEVTKTPGLYSLVVRPSFVYGPGDTASLMPRIVCAAAYIELAEKMKFLWDASMKINTVHGINTINFTTFFENIDIWVMLPPTFTVHDVCRAIWHLLTLPPSSAPPSGSIFNIRFHRCNRFLHSLNIYYF